MKTLLWNLLAFVLGVVAGSCVNMALVTVGPMLLPPPDGVDLSSTASFAATAHLLRPANFLFPFLAHALGTLAGALLAWKLSRGYRNTLALAIGVFFLAGGIAAATMIPAPMWFIVVDLVVAYVPMAMLAIWIGRKLAR